MKFDLTTDWSKWEVEEEGPSWYSFERLKSPEVGCICCGGYAEWLVKSDSYDSLMRVVECNNCMLADATSPDYPGIYHHRP